MDRLVPYFRRDPRLHLLVGDMGFGVIDALRAEFPQRLTNVGIMEPGATGIAAGMSLSGMVPIVYCIVNFLVFRSLEQIRNDVLLQGLNVKFLGTGARDYFRFLGPSHCCGDQDVQLLRLLGMPVYDPYSGTDSFEHLLDLWINDDAAGYLRV